MKLIIYASIVGVSLLSCKHNATNKQNNTIEDIMISQENSLRFTKKEDIKSTLSYLKTTFYKVPDDDIFRNVILDKFQIDIDTIDSKIKDFIMYEEAILDTQVSTDAIMYPTAYRDSKFLTLLVEDITEDFFSDRTSFIDFSKERKEILYHFNNWIFYDSKASFAYLKGKKPWTFMHMIHDYAYTGSDEYTQFILKKLRNGREAQEDVDEMVMGWGAKKKRYSVRENVVEKIIEFRPDLVFNIGMIVSDYSEYTVKSKELNQFYTYETKEQKLEDFSYLMNVLVDQGMVGILDELYNEKPMILRLLKKNDFYNYKDLKEYSLKAYGQTPYDEENPKPVYNIAVINDPDGYTNVRNKNGEVIFKIEDGEKFMVSKEGKNLIGDSYKEGWWFVRFKGNEGWVHSSRV
ncbi:hypothetical protein G1L22_13105, partial [Tenacibaculum finnmarkense]